MPKECTLAADHILRSLYKEVNAAPSDAKALLPPGCFLIRSTDDNVFLCAFSCAQGCLTRACRFRERYIYVKCIYNLKCVVVFNFDSLLQTSSPKGLQPRRSSRMVSMQLQCKWHCSFCILDSLMSSSRKTFSCWRV